MGPASRFYLLAAAALYVGEPALAGVVPHHQRSLTEGDVVTGQYAEVDSGKPYAEIPVKDDVPVVEDGPAAVATYVTYTETVYTTVTK